MAAFTEKEHFLNLKFIFENLEKDVNEWNNKGNKAALGRYRKRLRNLVNLSKIARADSIALEKERNNS